MGRAEGHVENYLRKRVKELGGEYRKTIYQGRKGAPDLWCFFPGGKLIIGETKSKVGELSAVQKAEIARLRELGQTVGVAYSREDVDEILSEVFL